MLGSEASSPAQGGLIVRVFKNSWDGKFSLQFVLSGVFIVLITLVGAALTTVAYFEAVRIIDQSADEVLLRISNTAKERTQSLFAPAESAVEVLATLPMLGDGELARQSLGLDAMISALKQSPDVTAVYSGNSDGEFANSNFSIRIV